MKLTLKEYINKLLHCKQTIGYSLIMAKKLCPVFLFVLIFFMLPLFSTDNFSGQKICDEVQKKLITAGFTPHNTNLISPAAGNFPYSISLEFSSASGDAIDGAEDYRSNRVLVIGQNDFLEHTDRIIPLLNVLAEKKHAFPVTVFFPPDGSKILDKSTSITGSDTFVKRIENPDSTMALIIRFSDINPSILFSGSSKDVSPLWLVQMVSDAFNQNNADYILPAGTFLTLYRFGLLRNDPIAHSFFSEGIPAATVIFSPNANCKDIIASFIDNFDCKKTAEWDRHYVFLHAAKHTFIINETAMVRALIAAAFLTLFILCAFSFLSGKHVHEYSLDIRSLWYLPLLTVFISFISLRLGQLLSLPAAKLFHLSPILQLYVSFQISFFIISLFYYFIVITAEGHNPYSYKFYVILSSLLNIFIFSALDISFLPLFATEYVLAIISRPARRTLPLLITEMLLFLPFLPYLVIIWQYMDLQKFSEFIEGGFVKNIFLSFAIQPFYLMWLTILSRIIENILSKSFFRASYFCARRGSNLYNFYLFCRDFSLFQKIPQHSIYSRNSKPSYFKDGGRRPAHRFCGKFFFLWQHIP